MKLIRKSVAAVAAVATLLSSCAFAKPIAFANGSTLMAEYGGPTMQEAQGFYSPAYWWSTGAGFLRLEAEDEAFDREIAYLRGNLLVKRWNLPGAQANIFSYAGVGSATGSDFGGSQTAWNAGLQGDYETRRVYLSVKSDGQYAQAFDHRINTAQVGLAPYVHDWDRLATWVVVQARQYSGGLYEGTEWAGFLRFFKGPVWFEIGATEDGDLQTMLMVNF